MTPPKRTEYSEAVRFAMKLQQYTAPVMAKAVEDTAFYRYNRLVSLNEVGGEPRRFGIPMAVLHRANQARCQSWPHSMLATSTHDSKRSEDVRARISVLSEIPELWHARVFRWRKLNRPHRRKLKDAYAPDRNDEYLYYQTLVGIWPAGTVGEGILAPRRERLESYMIKAVREAKVHSSWINPNREYEEAVLHFVRASLEPGGDNRFLVDLNTFLRQVARCGLLNSLAQTLLKLTLPGIPDLYQGNELWTFDLVDPDNRHPVPFRAHREMLSSLQALLQEGNGRPQAVQSLLRDPEDGRIKMFLTWQTLLLRKNYPDLFAWGDYLPLQAEEPFRESLCVFARQHEENRIIVLVPRYFARQQIFDQAGGSATPPDPPRHRIRINLPAAETGTPYTELFTGKAVFPEKEENQYWLPAGAILRTFPFSVLVKIDHGDTMRSSPDDQRHSSRPDTSAP